MKDPLFYMTEQIRKLSLEVAALEVKATSWQKTAEHLYEALDPITRNEKDRDVEFEQFALDQYYKVMNHFKLRPEPFDD